MSGVISILDGWSSARFDYRDGSARHLVSALKPPIESKVAATWINSLLSLLVGLEFRSDSHPDCRFEFIPGKEALGFFYSRAATLTYEIEASAGSNTQAARDSLIQHSLIQPITALRIEKEPAGG